jgi:hypothetical protein
MIIQKQVWVNFKSKGKKQENANIEAHCPMEVDELSIYTQKYAECQQGGGREHQ